MRAKDVMSTEVVTISHRATVLQAAKLMLDRDLSGPPVSAFSPSDGVERQQSR